jgi:hypothetical protein
MHGHRLKSGNDLIVALDDAISVEPSGAPATATDVKAHKGMRTLEQSAW